MSKLSIIAALSFPLVVLGCSSDPSQQQDSKPPEKSYHEIQQEKRLSSWQKTVNAYMKTHGLKPDDLSEGLQIAWAMSSSREIWGVLEAKGRLSADGCPIFDAIIMEGGATTSSFDRRNIPICPPK